MMLRKTSIEMGRVLWGVIQTLTGAWPMDSRFRGNDDMPGTRPQHRHSRESGNPVLLSESQISS